MPVLAANVPAIRPPAGLYSCFDQNDEATFQLCAMGLRAPDNSLFWSSKARFLEAWQRLRNTAILGCGWDTYGAEAPNDVAHALAREILSVLETDWLIPTRLMPSSEGGIAISFVEGDNRAEIEVYNTGEIVAAAYSAHSDPLVWELQDTDHALKQAIARIRVHLAA